MHSIEHSMKFLKEQLSFVLAEVLAMKKRLRISIPTLVILIFLLLLLFGGVIQLLLWVGGVILSLLLWVDGMALSFFLWIDGVILSFILWVGKIILSLFLWVGGVILSLFLWVGGVILWVSQMILSIFLWIGGVILSVFVWMGGVILWVGEMILSLFLWVGGVILFPFLWMGGVILSLFLWVGGVILSVCRVVLSVCKLVLPFPLLVGGMLLSLRFFIMVGEVVVPLILLCFGGMVLYFFHMLMGGVVLLHLLLLVGGVILSSLLLYIGRHMYNARGNLISSTGAGITQTSDLHCQFLPLLKDPQVLKNIEREYGVKFNVKLPNGSTKPIATFSSTIASMMSGSYPLTIESISDYLSSSGPGAVSWKFCDDNQQFIAMSPTDSAEIEKLYQQFLHGPSSHARCKLPYSREIGKWNYTYDFESMVQTNTKTQKKREIRRIDLPAQDLFSLCLSCRGLKDGVQASIASLHETLRGMVIKKPFGLCCSTDIVEPIIKLARSFCVEVDSSRDSTVISGGSDYLAKVFLVLRQKQMSLESTPLLSFPPEWEPQTNNIELKSVPVSSSEGAKVVSAFRKTMYANVSKIERIQNKFLYTKYDLCKKRMHEKNNGRVNEKWLFHGSRSVSPETIYKSEHGFDFRHAGQGCLWGKGAYFAVNAKYSGGYYAFDSPKGQQIFLAFVLTGDSIAMESNKSLVTPPSKEDGSGDYDSVNGVTALTGSSQIYIVYDHDKSYPAYIITFQQ